MATKKGKKKLKDILPKKIGLFKDDGAGDSLEPGPGGDQVLEPGPGGDQVLEPGPGKPKKAVAPENWRQRRLRKGK